MRKGSPDTAATTRLFALVASAARIAVVFRRGPTKQVQMLHWDLERDVVTPGQWLSGRIYNERCGLSPNGRLLVYFAGKFKTKIATFTAVSRPPFFTALALWPDGSTWGGGGFFEGDRRLILNYGRVIDELGDHKSIPEGFEVSHVVEYRARHGSEETPEASQGWTLKTRGVDGVPGPDSKMRVVFAEPWVQEKRDPARPRRSLERWWLGMFETDGPLCMYSYRVVDYDARGKPVHVEELGRLDWADWDSTARFSSVSTAACTAACWTIVGRQRSRSPTCGPTCSRTFPRRPVPASGRDRGCTASMKRSKRSRRSRRCTGGAARATLRA